MYPSSGTPDLAYPVTESNKNNDKNLYALRDHQFWKLFNQHEIKNLSRLFLWKSQNFTFGFVIFPY